MQIVMENHNFVGGKVMEIDFDISVVTMGGTFCFLRRMDLMEIFSNVLCGFEFTKSTFLDNVNITVLFIFYFTLFNRNNFLQL